MLWLSTALTWAGGTEVAPAVAEPAPVSVEAPIPGIALARGGLITTYAGIGGAAIGTPVFLAGIMNSEAMIGTGAALAVGGGVASITGPILTSVGQRTALDALAARGRPVPRVAKRVGDGLFFGGLATAGVGALLVGPNETTSVGILGLIIGGTAMVGSVIPYQVQQELIVRAARGEQKVTVGLGPTGVHGTF